MSILIYNVFVFNSVFRIVNLAFLQYRESIQYLLGHSLKTPIFWRYFKITKNTHLQLVKPGGI